MTSQPPQCTLPDGEHHQFASCDPPSPAVTGASVTLAHDDDSIFREFSLGDLEEFCMTLADDCEHSPQGLLRTVKQPTSGDLARCNTEQERNNLLSWFNRFNEWIYYKSVHGHGNVPQQPPKIEEDFRGWNQSLGNWVNKQRREKKNFDHDPSSTPYMYQERIDLLETHCFQWAEPKDQFGAHFTKLVEFHRIVGHAEVPTKPVKKDVDKYGTPEEQVEVCVARLLLEKDHSEADRAALFDMLMDQPFTRMISDWRENFVSKREKFMEFDPVTGRQRVKPRSKAKFDEWSERKVKLDSVDFRFKTP